VNNRLEELMREAGYAEPELAGRAIKLAESIIKECVTRCEEIALKHQVEETTYAAGKKAGAFECATDLKQHFGVE
jgi:hypothetical protein